MALDKREELEAAVREKLTKVSDTIVGLQHDIETLKQNCAELEQQMSDIDAEIQRNNDDYRQFSPFLDDLTSMLDAVSGNVSPQQNNSSKSSRKGSHNAVGANPNKSSSRSAARGKGANHKSAKSEKTTAKIRAESSRSDELQDISKVSSSESANDAHNLVANAPAQAPRKARRLEPIGEVDDVSQSATASKPLVGSPEERKLQGQRSTAEKPWLHAAEEGRRLRQQLDLVKSEASRSESVGSIIDDDVVHDLNSPDAANAFDVSKALKDFRQDTTKKNKGFLNKVFKKK